MVNFKATVLAAGLIVLGSVANASTCSGGFGFGFGSSSACYASSVGGGHAAGASSFYSVMQRLMNIGLRFGAGQPPGGILSFVSGGPSGGPNGVQAPVSSVPLPASALLLLGGLGGMAFVRSRKKEA